MNRRLALACLVGALLIGPALGQEGEATKEARAFDDAVEQLSARLIANGNRFGMALLKATSGGEDERTAARLARLQSSAEVGRALRQFKALKAPATPVAFAYAVAYRRWLEMQQKTIREVAPKLVELAADKGLTTKAKQERIEAIIARHASEEGRLQAEVKKARLAFAKRHALPNLPALEAQAYDDAVERLRQRLTFAGQRFGQAQSKAYAGGAEDVAATKAALGLAQKEALAVAKEAEALKVPPGPEGAAYAGACRRWFAMQRKVVADDAPRVLEVLEDDGLNARGKEVRAKAILGAIVKTEEKLRPELDKARKAFLERFKLAKP